MWYRYLAAIGVTLAAALGPAVATAQAQSGNAGEMRPVRLMTITPENLVESRSFPGRVRALQSVDLAFQVGGQLIDFPLAEGQRLPAGAPLARLRLDPFERAVRQAEATLAQDRQTLQRMEALAGSAVTRVDLEAARTKLTLSEIAFEAAEAALRDATLLAPFDALVARRLVANFTTLQPGEPVVRLHDMSEVLVDIAIPEILARQSAEGDLDFTATFSGSDAAYPLSIREYQAESADVGQTFRLTLRFDSLPEGAGILPGASTMVEGRRRSMQETVLTLPQSALAYAPDGAAHVFVFHPDDNPAAGVLEQVPVTLRLLPDTRVELVGGPPLGAEIVASGAAQLADGMAVRRFTAVGE